MYTTTVKVKKILKGTRAYLIGCIPLIWAFLVLASLIIGVKVTYFALIVMFLLFIGVIPMFIILRKLSEPFRGAESFEIKEVTFHVEEGILYTDDIKLDAYLDEEDGSIHVENMYNYISFRHKTDTIVVRFIGIVERPYADDFLLFLKNNNVEI